MKGGKRPPLENRRLVNEGGHKVERVCMLLGRGCVHLGSGTAVAGARAGGRAPARAAALPALLLQRVMLSLVAGTEPQGSRLHRLQAPRPGICKLEHPGVGGRVGTKPTRHEPAANLGTGPGGHDGLHAQACEAAGDAHHLQRGPAGTEVGLREVGLLARFRFACHPTASAASASAPAPAFQAPN
jgi:hypothetical protein